VTDEAPLSVITPEDPWAYGISVPLECSSEVSFLVEVRIRVLGGCIGVSCTSEKLDQLTDEVFIRESQGVTCVTLFAAPNDDRVLVRNGPERAGATFELVALRCSALPPHLSAEARSVELRPVAQWHRFYGTAGDSLVEKVRVREYLSLAAPTPLPWFDDLTFIAYPGDQLSRAVYVSGQYEPNTAVVLRRMLGPGAVFVDCGAHVGVFTMLASRWVGGEGRVISFEPSSRERARLVEHTHVNQLANVTVIAAAVADREGQVTLKVAIDQFGGLNTIGAAFAYDVPVLEEVSVPVTTLDISLAANHLERVDVIKMDIEGAEYAALRGATSVLDRWRPALIFELFSVALQANAASRDDLDLLLSRAGYRLFTIDEETASLSRLESLTQVDQQNIVALPHERADQNAE
jgi:FkbM family methyltransferase